MQCESCLHKFPADEWCNTDTGANLEHSRIVFTKVLSTAVQVVNPIEKQKAVHVTHAAEHRARGSGVPAAVVSNGGGLCLPGLPTLHKC